jgi:hypothetical protein
MAGPIPYQQWIFSLQQPILPAPAGLGRNRTVPRVNHGGGNRFGGYPRPERVSDIGCVLPREGVATGALRSREGGNGAGRVVQDAT